MKGGRDKRSVRVEFVLTEAEAALIKERMAELGITNLSAYLRKMAVDGYIIHLDMGDIQEMIRLLRICSNNLNGGGLAGRDDRRRKPRTQRFCIWINLWAGHFRCPALFFTIRGCLTRQLFLFGGIT